jgi:hypothetical protein
LAERGHTLCPWLGCRGLRVHRCGWVDIYGIAPDGRVAMIWDKESAMTEATSRLASGAESGGHGDH